MPSQRQSASGWIPTKGVYCIESFDPFCLLDLKKLRPDTCRGQLSMNFLKDPSGLPLYKRFIAGNLPSELPHPTGLRRLQI